MRPIDYTPPHHTPPPTINPSQKKDVPNKTSFSSLKRPTSGLLLPIIDIEERDRERERIDMENTDTERKRKTESADQFSLLQKEVTFFI